MKETVDGLCFDDSGDRLAYFVCGGNLGTRQHATCTRHNSYWQCRRHVVPGSHSGELLAFCGKRPTLLTNTLRRHARTSPGANQVVILKVPSSTQQADGWSEIVRFSIRT